MTITVGRRQFLRLSILFSVQMVAAGCAASVALPTAVDSAISDETTVAPPTFALSPAPLSLPTAPPITVADGTAGVSYALPLTTQHVTNTTAEFYFELIQPADGLLLVHSLDVAVNELVVPFDASTTVHQMSVEGLTPGLGYQVTMAVKDLDGELRRPGFLDEAWGDISFRTWDNRQPIRFAIIGDSGFGDSVTPQLSEQMASSNLDFVLQAGDIVYHVEENKDPFEAFGLKYYRPFSEVLHRMPIYPVVGNHDDENTTLWQGRPFYDHAFSPITDMRFKPPSDVHNDWYAFAYGNVQFVMLNTEAMNDSQKRIEQKVWLAERLADPRFSPSIPVFHIPPYSAGLHVGDGVAVQADWVPIFQQYGAKLVLAAHDHNYERLSLNGITYIVSGGGSATLYEKTEDVPGLLVFNRISHFTQFEIYPDRIDLKAVALGGEVIDQLSIQLQ